MGIGGWLKEAIGGSAVDIVGTIGDTVDKFVQTPEEKAELDLAKKQIEIKFKKLEMDLEAKYLEDKQSAREMQMKTRSKVPGILTIIFTLGYFLLTTFMLNFVMQMVEVEMTDFQIMFVSSIFGAFNAIMVQIISFYFGSSNGSEEQGALVANRFNGLVKNKEEDKD